MDSVDGKKMYENECAAWFKPAMIEVIQNFLDGNRFDRAFFSFLGIGVAFGHLDYEDFTLRPLTCINKPKLGGSAEVGMKKQVMIVGVPIAGVENSVAIPKLCVHCFRYFLVLWVLQVDIERPSHHRVQFRLPLQVRKLVSLHSLLPENVEPGIIGVQ